MFCQWCGKEREADAIAIHHCGSSDRPPAFCIACGRPLAAGDAACAACGTPAGEAPKPAAAAPKALSLIHI